MVGVVRATRMDFTARVTAHTDGMECDETRTGNKEEGGEVEEEAEKAESGERVDEVETEERGKRKREREGMRRVPHGGFAAGIIGVSSLPTGHNGPSWRVAKRPLLGW